jgi:hypothetical protein
MPSESGAVGVPTRPSRWAWLYSQGLGLLCGQTAILLLAVGSVVLAATRDGASAGIAMEDLRGFFDTPSWAHTWLYLLMPVFTLYALNTLLATWRSVLRRVRAGVWSPSAWAAPAMHVAFLLGLLAHIVGGFWSEERGLVLLGPEWRDLEDGRRARVTQVDVRPLPDGGIEQIYANLEVSDAAGAVSASLLAFNRPLSRGWGSDLLLLVRPTPVPGPAVVSLGGARCVLDLEESCDLGGTRVTLLFLQHPGRGGGIPLAHVRVDAPSPSSSRRLWLTQGRPQRVGAGAPLVLEGTEPRYGVLLHRRHAPGTPLALAASLLLALGLALLMPRLVQGVPPTRPR